MKEPRWFTPYDALFAATMAFIIVMLIMAVAFWYVQ